MKKKPGPKPGRVLDTYEWPKRPDVLVFLQSLTPREEQFCRMYWGLGGSPKYTLRGIADHFAISNERVRQIIIRVNDKKVPQWNGRVRMVQDPDWPTR